MRLVALRPLARREGTPRGEATLGCKRIARTRAAARTHKLGDRMKEHAPEPETESIEELRWRLVRRLADINEGWRVCEQRVCRRARHCAVARARCVAQLLTLCSKLSSAPEP